MDTGLSEVDNAVAEFGGAFDVHVVFPEDSRICGQPHCLARYRVEWDFIPSESPGAREEDREGHHFVRWRLKGSSFTGSLRGVTTLTRAEAEALDADADGETRKRFCLILEEESPFLRGCEFKILLPADMDEIRKSDERRLEEFDAAGAGEEGDGSEPLLSGAETHHTMRMFVTAQMRNDQYPTDGELIEELSRLKSPDGVAEIKAADVDARRRAPNPPARRLVVEAEVPGSGGSGGWTLS